MAIDALTTIDTVRLVMKLEEARARVAAQNIALANVPGSKVSRFDMATPMTQLRNAIIDPSAFTQVVGEQQALALESLVITDRKATLSLDSEVADLSAASGRYQALAEGLSRQFALMQLAIRGGR